MINSPDFFKSVLDTITANIAVIDKQGYIHYVNQSWEKFAKSNDHILNGNWDDVNYLETCDHAALMGDELAKQAADGIRRVINNEQKLFYIEYPCHSPHEERWFMMRVTEFQLGEETYFVLSHYNITERKLAEEKVLNLSYLDGLTNIANRRHFDNFLNDEWNRCLRLNLPISCAIIDLDHFKSLNDIYGHQAGDECLKKIAVLLKNITKRPSDICARYGGDEFVLLLGNTDLESSKVILNKLLDDVRELKIEHKSDLCIPNVTVSIGLATMHPDKDTSKEDLIKAADTVLYRAKELGKNQMRYK
jgi:diguanylate cyclase (GGDEF)-like protein